MKEELSIGSADQPKSFESLLIGGNLYEEIKSLAEAEDFLNWFRDKKRELSLEPGRLERENENNPLLAEFNKISNEECQLDSRLFNELDWEKDIKEKRQIEERMNFLSEESKRILSANPEMDKALDVFDAAWKEAVEEYERFIESYRPIARAIEKYLLPFFLKKDKLKKMEEARNNGNLKKEIDDLYDQLEKVLTEEGNSKEEKKIETLIRHKEFELKILPRKIEDLKEEIEDDEYRLRRRRRLSHL
jgi:hypothetical protein